MSADYLVLINSKSGRASAEGPENIERDLRSVLDTRGSTEVLVAPVEELMEVARQSGSRALVTVGGDGTIAGIASCVYGRKDAPLYIPLPYGTANLIPRDLGMPMDPVEALRLSIDAPPRKIDFVDAQGRALLHSAGFGTFAEIAEAREALRSAPTFGDRVGAALMMWDQFLETGEEPYRITVDGKLVEIESAAVFVSNNPITGGQGALPLRERLDTGQIVVYISRGRGVFALVQHVIEAMTGQFDESPEFIRETGREVEIESRGHGLHYTIDGEPGSNRDRIRFTMYPSCLTVPDLR
ncbi:diacylglycerol/lipid kinase family protein [Parvularcula lutaonensis]|uniref:Diacylglycerol/lipid kinase family protein n=1 Tax=Parvularcula lutaonensis TaxID=491923 RepID=A0ABV7MAL1_9PROT|nr:diacylglycerol kinase family protein [Parvularcula lutaonensis]GGY38290.1 diacylglycerol kinase [Parvularcula lutaonensis]